jgi:ubiquinone/menaquinone biosynthesis C-methylase UbiE
LRSRFEEQWRTRFEAFADLHDDDAGIAGWTKTGLDARLRRFLDLWRPGEPGGRWLDAGCGGGTYTRVLLRHGHDVVSVDYSLPTLRKAAARGMEGAVFAVADVRELPFREEQFDGALCLGVTQALTHSEPALRELARLLKPGGQLWIDALNGRCLVHAIGGLLRRILGQPLHLRYESPVRLRRLVEECGFTDVQLHWLPIMPTRRRRLQRFAESQRVGWILGHIPLIGLLISHGFIVHARKLA